MKIFRIAPDEEMSPGGVGIFIKATRLEQVFLNINGEKEGAMVWAQIWRDSGAVNRVPYRLPFSVIPNCSGAFLIQNRPDSCISTEGNWHNRRSYGTCTGPSSETVLRDIRHSHQGTSQRFVSDFMKPVTVELSVPDEPIAFIRHQSPSSSPHHERSERR